MATTAGVYAAQEFGRDSVYAHAGKTATSTNPITVLGFTVVGATVSVQSYITSRPSSTPNITSRPSSTPNDKALDAITPDAPIIVNGFRGA
jgi:hypothetical protein